MLVSRSRALDACHALLAVPTALPCAIDELLWAKRAHLERDGYVSRRLCPGVVRAVAATLYWLLSRLGHNRLAPPSHKRFTTCD